MKTLKTNSTAYNKGFARAGVNVSSSRFVFIENFVIFTTSNPKSPALAKPRLVGGNFMNETLKMKIEEKLRILKIIKIILLIIFTPIFLFYLIIVLPEYLACINCVYEGEMGTDIWGNEIQCFGESKEFGKVFFQLLTLIIGAFSIAS